MNLILKVTYFVNKARTRLLSVSVFVDIHSGLQQQRESQILEIMRFEAVILCVYSRKTFINVHGMLRHTLPEKLMLDTGTRCAIAYFAAIALVIL